MITDKKIDHDLDVDLREVRRERMCLKKSCGLRSNTVRTWVSLYRVFPNDSNV